jgi:hypothetical protein
MTQILLRERLETIAELDQVGRQTLVSEIDEHYGASRDRFAEAAEQTAWQEASRYWQEMCYLEKLIDATGSRGR